MYDGTFHRRVALHVLRLQRAPGQMSGFGNDDSSPHRLTLSWGYLILNINSRRRADLSSIT